MQLNKFIAHAGYCSRRKAVILIETGHVTVNGKIITHPGYRVTPTDVVEIDGKAIAVQALVYILLNKPKDYITTVSDERGRRTVLDLLPGDIAARVYPVGRLDRATTGLLLLTNDGDLAHKLAHPSGNVQKMYHATLDRIVTQADVDKIRQGVLLADGKAEVDDCKKVSDKPPTVYIVLHSGKNRIVRRIFEALDYEVVKLDRFEYAGLTKKGLSVGEWRYLSDYEIAHLKQLSFQRSNVSTIKQ